MDITVNLVVSLSPHLQDLLTQFLPHIDLDGMALPIKQGTPVHRVETAPLPATEKPAKRTPRKPKAEPQPEQNVAPAVTPPTPAQPVTAAPAPSSPAPVAGGVQAQKPTSTPAPGPVLTLDDVARTVSALLPRIGMDTLRDVLAQFKLKHVVKLTPEQFSPFLTALQEAAKTVGAQPPKAAS